MKKDHRRGFPPAATTAHEPAVLTYPLGTPQRVVEEDERTFEVFAAAVNAERYMPRLRVYHGCTTKGDINGAAERLRQVRAQMLAEAAITGKLVEHTVLYKGGETVKQQYAPGPIVGQVVDASLPADTGPCDIEAS